MTRRKSPVYREPCGCTHDGRAWLVLCPTDEAEFTERHVYAHIDHVERQPPGTYIAERVTA